MRVARAQAKRGRNYFLKKRKCLPRDEMRKGLTWQRMVLEMISGARVIYCLPLRIIAAFVANRITEEIIETVLNNDYKWLSICLHSVRRK